MGWVGALRPTPNLSSCRYTMLTRCYAVIALVMLASGGHAQRYVASQTIALHLSATDPQAADGTASGVAAYRLGEEDVWNEWVMPMEPAQAVALDVQTTLSAGNGAKRICVEYRDLAGNISPTYSLSLILDSVAPYGTLSPSALMGDIDGDGFVGFADFNILRANWGMSIW